MTHQELALAANTIRAHLLKSLHAAGSGHSGGPLGMADIFAALYCEVLNHNPQDPLMPERDRFVLSNGHICPVLYATLAHVGYFPVEELMTLRKFGSRLQGHPHRGSLPGIETTSGPLGSGLSQAVGMALAARMDGKNIHVYCATSDGEHQEGNLWEAVMLAAKYRLDSVIQIMDRNYIQIEGNTEDVMPLDPIADKYKAFGWHVIEINGHRFEEILGALAEAKAHTGSPVLINALTTPGKGVSFMEGQYTWHGKPPSTAELEQALKDLAVVRENILNGTYVY